MPFEGTPQGIYAKDMEESDRQDFLGWVTELHQDSNASLQEVLEAARSALRSVQTRSAGYSEVSSPESDAYGDIIAGLEALEKKY